MPHFTIEAEGETNPLTAQSVLHTLIQASGSARDAQGVKVATQQLSNWEKQPGYYSSLQDVYADFSLDQSVRFQAVIQLKNGIDKHWRKTSTNPIRKEEKAKIRSRAIEIGLLEPRHSLALHNALMIAKIVRFEFPHDWPDVITNLIQILRQSGPSGANPQFASNALMITLQIVKELATGTLARTRKSFQQVALELLQVLGSIYIQLVAIWAGSLEADSELHFAAQSCLALKAIRRILVVGFDHPHREPDVAQFWQILQQQQQKFMEIWQAHLTSPSFKGQEILSKHLFQLSKLYLEMARTHAASFVLLSGSMGVLGRSWNTITLLGHNLERVKNVRDEKWGVKEEGEAEEESSPLEKLGLKALLLLRACVKMVFNPAHTFKYQHPQDKEDRHSAIEMIKSNVLTNDAVVGIMETLVTQYFVLRPSDLRDWKSEPDEWERREEEIADAWEYALRPCAEKLFLDLVINFKALTVPKLLQVFERYSSVSETDVLLKESIYSAIGVAAACLEDILDFNSFLRDTLVAEVQINREYYNILRRRTAILLGQWVPIKPEALDRPLIYQIFTHLLSTTDQLNDSVVRVTAGRQLRLVLEPFEFRYSDFAPYATPVLRSLMSLIAETELTETKMALLETVRVAVTKLEGHIEPYADGIMNMLPPLWQDSGEEHLMKQAILTMITAIFTSLKEKSIHYHHAVLALIHDAIQPNSEASVYLLEEALELWAVILQQTPNADNLSDELQHLLVSIIPLLDTGSEHIRQVFELIDSYNLLSPGSLLKVSRPLFTSLGSLLAVSTSARARETSQAHQIVENIVAIWSRTNSLVDENVRELGFGHLIRDMIDSGYFRTLLGILGDAQAYHQDPRPSRQPPHVIGPAETSLFSILARIALAKPAEFVDTIVSLSPSSSIDWLINEWLGHFDSIGDSLRKKLQVLAITHLLAASSPPPTFMLEQLQSLMTVWTDILLELALDAPAETKGDYLWHSPQNGQVPETWPDDTPEDKRRKALSNVDPIYSINLPQFVRERLQEAIEGLGGEEFFRRDWLSRVDEAVVRAFGKASSA